MHATSIQDRVNADSAMSGPAWHLGYSSAADNNEVYADLEGALQKYQGLPPCSEISRFPFESTQMLQYLTQPVIRDRDSTFSGHMDLNCPMSFSPPIGHSNYQDTFRSSIMRLPTQDDDYNERIFAPKSSNSELLASLLGPPDFFKFGEDTGFGSQNSSPSRDGFQSSSSGNLYKTELCRSWCKTSTCRYGGKCQFAHGLGELRPIKRHPKYKTEVCRTFARTGNCPYGMRCRFIHYFQALHPSGNDPLASLSRTSTCPPATAPDHSYNPITALNQAYSLDGLLNAYSNTASINTFERSTGGLDQLSELQNMASLNLSGDCAGLRTSSGPYNFMSSLPMQERPLSSGSKENVGMQCSVSDSLDQIALKPSMTTNQILLGTAGSNNLHANNKARSIATNAPYEANRDEAMADQHRLAIFQKLTRPVGNIY